MIFYLCEPIEATFPVPIKHVVADEYSFRPGHGGLIDSTELF